MGDVGVPSDVSVGDAEVRKLVRVVAGHGALGVVARERLVDDVVGRRGVDLPRGAIEQLRPRRVIADQELEPDPAHQAVERPGLGLRSRARPAEGLAGGCGRRSFVVVGPLRREVPVEVDAVAHVGPAVAVVVAQVLAPQPVAGGEAVVIAVGVGDRDEPQLGRVDQLGEFTVAAVAVDHAMGEPADHLRGDPLARVLGPDVEDRGGPACGRSCAARRVTFRATMSWPWWVSPIVTSLVTAGWSAASRLNSCFSPPRAPYGLNTLYPSASRVAASRGSVRAGLRRRLP